MTSNVEGHNSGDTISAVRTIGGLILVVLLLAFVLANLDDVTINFLLFSIQTKMLVAMVICALLGAAAALLISGQGLFFGIGRRKVKRS